LQKTKRLKFFTCTLHGEAISYLESSFLTAHAGLTKRATLERSIRGAVLIGCSKTVQMAGTKSETPSRAKRSPLRIHACTAKFTPCCSTSFSTTRKSPNSPNNSGLHCLNGLHFGNLTIFGIAQKISKEIFVLTICPCFETFWLNEKGL